MEAINLTPSWGEWGNTYRRLAESGERKAIRELRSDFARAMACCEALKAVGKTMTEDQRRITSRVMVAELGKQGY